MQGEYRLLVEPKQIKWHLNTYKQQKPCASWGYDVSIFQNLSFDSPHEYRQNWVFKKSPPWKVFSKTSIFRNLKLHLHVDGIPKHGEKTVFKNIHIRMDRTWVSGTVQLNKTSLMLFVTPVTSWNACCERGQCLSCDLLFFYWVLISFQLATVALIFTAASSPGLQMINVK